MEDNKDPIKELKRLLYLKYNYNLIVESIHEKDKNNLESALNLGIEALRISPNRDRVLLNFGDVYYKPGSRESALKAYKNSIAINSSKNI